MKKKNCVEFVGENCDRYVIPLKNIIYFKINNLDYIDFINNGLSDINYYDLAIKEPIIIKDIFSKYIPYDSYYNYRDFDCMSIYFNNKKFEFSNIWIGDNIYATLGQNAYKDKDGIYHLTFNRHYKPSYFDTLEMENLIRLDIYNLPATKKITDDMVEKIEKLFISYYFFDEFNDNHYFDLGKFKNLKKIHFDIEFEINYHLLALNCPNLEEIEFDDYFPLPSKVLKQLKLFKKLKTIKLQDGMYLATEKGFKFDRAKEDSYDDYQTEQEKIIRRIKEEYDSTLSSLKRDFDYEFIVENEFEKCRKDIDNKYLEYKEKYKF